MGIPDVVSGVKRDTIYGCIFAKPVSFSKCGRRKVSSIKLFNIILNIQDL